MAFFTTSLSGFRIRGSDSGSHDGGEERPIIAAASLLPTCAKRGSTTCTWIAAPARRRPKQATCLALRALRVE